MSSIDAPEFVLATTAPTTWATRMLSDLGAAAVFRPMLVNGSTPLGDAEALFDGLIFTEWPGLDPIDGLRVTLVIGVHESELAFARRHGVPRLVEHLTDAGVFPYSDPDRARLEGLDDSRESDEDLMSALEEDVVAASARRREENRNARRPSNLALVLTSLISALLSGGLIGVITGSWVFGAATRLVAFSVVLFLARP